MSFKLIGHIPDQDHIRNKMELGTFNTLEEVYDRIKKELDFWKGTSNEIRLQQPGSFEVLYKAPGSIDFILIELDLENLSEAT